MKHVSEPYGAYLLKTITIKKKKGIKQSVLTLDSDHYNEQMS